MTVYDLANRGLIRISLLAIGLAASFTAGVAMAGALVEFPNLSGREPAHLIGYLARPDAGLSALASRERGDNAPYSAVVVLHGCSGISSHSAAIADRLGAWGYVALTVDTLGPRGITGRCGGQIVDQAFDAYAALRYLSGLEFVDPAQIAVLGQSMGGQAALYAIARDLAAQYFTERFRAAAYYPNCGVANGSDMTTPVLVLIGEADEWNSAERCSEVAAPTSGQRADRPQRLSRRASRLRRRATEPWNSRVGRLGGIQRAGCQGR